MDVVQHMLQQLANKRSVKDKAKVVILQTMVEVLGAAGKLEQKAKDSNTLTEFLEKCLTTKTKPRAFQSIGAVAKQIETLQETLKCRNIPQKSNVNAPHIRLRPQQPQDIHIHVNVPTITTLQSGGTDVVKASPLQRKKHTIPKSIKEKVWYTYMGKQKTEGLCPCCLSETIKIMHFHAGHVVSEVNGGSATVENLRPICGRCNLQMGSMNMQEYMLMYYGRYLA